MANPFEAAFVGLALTNAEILEHQVNLYFPRAYIAVYNPITIQRGQHRTPMAAPEFPSTLSSVVGESLRSVEAQANHNVVLVFESGARLEISTNPIDYSGPEAFSAQGPDGQLFVEQ